MMTPCGGRRVRRTFGMKTFLVLVAPLSLTLLQTAVWAEAVWAEAPLDGPTLLDRMVSTHDPKGDWMSAKVALTIRSTYADGQEILRRCEVDYADASYSDRYETDGHTVETSVVGDRCGLKIDGKTEFTPELAKSLRVSCERARLYRNYIGYLWGLPMKLRDPGTVIEPKVTRGQFNGQDVLTLHVTYEQAVGTDRWWFHAKPETYELVGYAFEKADGKGEYIVLEGSVGMKSGPRIPQTRSWYLTKEKRFLGRDHLEKAVRIR